MARPRHDDEGPSAVDRMETAFFDALRTTPFQKVTVSAIVKAAGVNRNSFYYHFTDLDDLAHSAVDHLLIPEIPRLLADGFGFESEQVHKVLHDAHGEERLRTVLVITGPHSTAELRGVLKHAVIDVWLSMFDLDHDDLDAQESATLHFVLGGMFELLSRIRPRELLEELTAVRGLPILQTNVRIVLESLTSARQRVTSRAHP